MSFSDPRVQKELNRNFVNTFTNTTGDRSAGQSINHRPGDPAGNCIRGNGKQNIQTIFMTPAGEIFHVATGFLSSDDLLSETGFALKLFRALRNLEPAARPNAVSGAHHKRLVENNLNARSANGGIGEFFSSVNRNGINGQNLFRSMIERQFKSDQQFSIDNPLMTFQQLERNPTTLVGNGRSFFASSNSGG